MSSMARALGRGVRRGTSGVNDRYAAMDGYRGLFVVLVIAYHFGVTSLVGGWVGINHFFVFSGFLIARLLIKERQRTGHIDVVRFYVRRARRVLPAMFVLVAAVLVHTAFFEDAQQKKQFAGDAFATLGFFLNWRLISRDDAYFDQFGHPSPLRHAWTLSVEEQFYVVVPFLIMAIAWVTWRRLGRFGIAMALAVLSAWWTAHIGYHSFEDQARLYYGTDTRAQALLVGVAFGFLFGLGSDGRGPVLPSRALTQTLGIIGTVVSISAVFLLDADTSWVYNSGGVLLFALGASLMGWSSIDPRDLLLNRVFGWAPLAFLGRISYGLYLYHWPVHLWFTIPGAPSVVEGLVQFLVTLALAVVSFRYLEAPVLQYGLRGIMPRWDYSRRRLAASGIGLVLAVSSLGLWQTRVSGVPENVPMLVDDTRPYHAGTTQHPFSLVGDSVGSSLARGWKQDIYSDLPMDDNTMLGCDLVPAPIVHDGKVSDESPHCREWREGLEGKMRAHHDQSVVVVGDAHFLTTHRLDGRDAAPRTDAGAAAIRRSLDDIHAKADAAGVRHTVLVTIPCRRIDADKLDPSLRFFADQGSDDAAVEWANGVMKGWARSHRDVSVADLHQQLCSNGYQPVVKGVSLYHDTLHFTPRAAAMIWTWLAPQAAAATEK